MADLIRTSSSNPSSPAAKPVTFPSVGPAFAFAGAMTAFAGALAAAFSFLPPPNDGRLMEEEALAAAASSAARAFASCGAPATRAGGQH